MAGINTEHLDVHPSATMDESSSITGRSVKLGPHTHIAAGVNIFCPDGFELGACSYIGPGSSIRCIRFSCPEGYLYAEKNVDIGRGGSVHSPESVVSIGKGTLLTAGVILNPSSSITIGSECGIAGNIWTHGAWPDVLRGGPEAFGPVRLGDRVWLPKECTVLPGVTIGSDVVISMNTLVNRDIPSGSFAAGIPVQIKKEGVYPRPVDTMAILRDLVAEYIRIASWKEITGRFRVTVEPPHNVRMILEKSGHEYLFDLERRVIISDLLPCAEIEDLRDFLRRHGIRIFTGAPFRSIPHPAVARWEKAEDSGIL